jgi:hypothetical protein
MGSRMVIGCLGDASGAFEEFLSLDGLGGSLEATVENEKLSWSLARRVSVATDTSSVWEAGCETCA